MGALKGLRLVQNLSEIVIKRDFDVARIAYSDNPTEGGIHLELGPQLATMSDEEVLDAFNNVVFSMMHSVETFRPLEITPGQPQIKFDKRSKSFEALGQVLRCELEDDAQLNVMIRIDDKTLSPDQFMRMISGFRGWGMRIEFMDESQLTSPPSPVVQDAPAKISKAELNKIAKAEELRLAKRDAFRREQADLFGVDET